MEDYQEWLFCADFAMFWHVSIYVGPDGFTACMATSYQIVGPSNCLYCTLTINASAQKILRHESDLLLSSQPADESASQSNSSIPGLLSLEAPLFDESTI
jgi:hypothetical protein